MDESVKKAARAILVVFRDKGLGAGDLVHFADFGKALKWDAGFVKHENQQLALQYLVKYGYVNETQAGLELTRKGADAMKSV
jgi:hypothetical protein